VFVAVAQLAGKTTEQRARLDPAAVVLDGGDLHVEGLTRHMEDVNFFEQTVHVHGAGGAAIG
jgi:activator of 2-hydroxyglutaryl-CoA dehydratase